MATFVDCVIGWGVSDGETIDSGEIRNSTVSGFDIAGGATPVASRGGIIPAGGSPLEVTALGTPAMAVQVNAGRCAIPGNAATTPVFGLTLTTTTNLDIAAAHATLPRIDLVVARVNSPGTSAAFGQIEVITGTAAASPSRPTVPNTGNDHSIVLKTINVLAAVTTITSPNVVTNAATDARWTTAPGGMVPVPSHSSLLSGGVSLPDYTPFVSQAAQMPGLMLPTAGAALWGPMTRHFYGNVTTNAQGDITVNFGLYTSGGTFTAAPFPNAIIGAIATDATDPVAFDDGILWKYYPAFSTTSVAAFRAYNTNTQNPYLSFGAVTVAVLAWGR